MVEDIQSIVKSALASTLEAMAFLDIDEEMPEAPPDDAASAPLCKSEIEVLEPVQGHILLILPEPLLAEIVRSISGDPDHAPNKTEMCDTSAELINTFAGRLMRSLVDKEQIFRLGLPDTGTAEAGDRELGEINYTFSVRGYEVPVAVKGLIKE